MVPECARSAEYGGEGELGWAGLCGQQIGRGFFLGLGLLGEEKQESSNDL